MSSVVWNPECDKTDELEGHWQTGIIHHMICDVYLCFMYLKTNRVQDVQLSICSYVVENPGGCLNKITPSNAKFHSFLKSYLYL